MHAIKLFYQLDLTTPGISPLRASDRKQRRHTPNFRKKARGRPQSWQRLCWRDLNFGVLASLTRFAVVAISLSILLYELFLLIPDSLSLCALAERHAEAFEQLARAVVVLGGGHDGHVHALDF